MVRLVVSEPLTLLLDWRDVAGRAAQLERAATLGFVLGLRREWKQEASRREIAVGCLEGSPY